MTYSFITYKLTLISFQLQKFKIMIPYDQMTDEEFELTFPDWAVTRENPSIWPNEEKVPGLSRKEAAELAKPDGPPFSIP